MIISYKRLNNIFLPSVSLKDPDYSTGLSTAIVKVKDRTAPDYKPTIACTVPWAPGVKCILLASSSK